MKFIRRNISDKIANDCSKYTRKIFRNIPVNCSLYGRKINVRNFFLQLTFPYNFITFTLLRIYKISFSSNHRRIPEFANDDVTAWWHRALFNHELKQLIACDVESRNFYPRGTFVYSLGKNSETTFAIERLFSFFLFTKRPIIARLSKLLISTRASPHQDLSRDLWYFCCLRNVTVPKFSSLNIHCVLSRSVIQCCILT